MRDPMPPGKSHMLMTAAIAYPVLCFMKLVYILHRQDRFGK